MKLAATTAKMRSWPRDNRWSFAKRDARVQARHSGRIANATRAAPSARPRGAAERAMSRPAIVHGPVRKKTAQRDAAINEKTRSPRGQARSDASADSFGKPVEQSVFAKLLAAAI